ncbi:glycosyltransferase family 4 protein [Mesorhizobium sp. M0809]
MIDLKFDGNASNKTESSQAQYRGKILLSINTSWNIYNFRRGLIQSLIAAGYEVVVASPYDQYSSRLADLGCRHIPVSIDSKGTSPLRDLALLINFIRIIRRERPNAFLGWTIKPNVYGSVAARAFAIPTLNNVSGLGTAFINTTLLTRIAENLYRFAFRRSGCVLFQNEDDRALFLNRNIVRAEQAGLVPGSGVDLSQFSPRSAKIVGKRELTFLLIARVLWDKGIGEYVEAARLVKKDFPHVRFQLLGPLDSLNRTAVSSSVVSGWVKEGVIEYLGTTDDVRPFIDQSDCIVLPSYREGTPRTLLEAAAMAKPLIATNVPGCKNVVNHGENGFLCEIRNAVDLSKKIEDFVKLSPAVRTLMGKKSRELAERRFDERFVINAYLSALERLLQ